MTTPQTPVDALIEASQALLERYKVMGCGDGIEARNVELAIASARALAAVPANTTPLQGWKNEEQSKLNDWFLSLPEGRQKVLIDDKWMLASAAFLAGQQVGGVPAGFQKGAWRHIEADTICDLIEKHRAYCSQGTETFKDASLHQLLRDVVDAAAAASPSPSAVQPLSEAHGDVRVACITLDGSTLYIPAKEITDFGIGDDDGETYTLTFKTMTRAEFEALGEFDGF